MEYMKRQREIDKVNTQMINERKDGKDGKVEKQREAEQFFKRNDGLLKKELGLIEQKIQSHHDQMESYRESGLQSGIESVMKGRIQKYDQKQDRYSQR